MLRLTLEALDPELYAGEDDPPDVDPIGEFARLNIGTADTITFEVVYIGYEDAPDVIVANRAGEVISVA